MRLRSVRSALAVLALAGLSATGLAACTGTPAPGGSGSATSAPASSSSTAAPTPGGSSTSTPTQVPTTLGPGDTGPNPSLPGPNPVPGQGNAELSITVLDSPEAAPRNYTLVCQGGTPAAESNHPTAAAACAALEDNPGLLVPPTPTDQACTQQFGGPQTATVTGAVDGTEVTARFSRTDGCQIALWDAAAGILGSSGGAA
ncbi:SSI family serine proteinase inhibitor [Paenarthrobacter sp. NyZ202]|uniref:SSI family serine proteinase inhibitor n=1 Tax=Paenarthrobacter sp. NyZ202 TaxID=3402689 RepID=UPI003CF6B569